MSNIVKHNLTIVPSFLKIGRHLAKVFTVVRHTRGFGACVEQPAVVCQECTVVCQECTVADDVPLQAEDCTLPVVV